MDTNIILYIVMCILIIVCYFSISYKLRKIDNIDNDLYNVRHRTPLVPFGIVSNDEDKVGLCPECNKYVHEKDSKYECKYCYQRLDWLDNIEGGNK